MIDKTVFVQETSIDRFIYAVENAMYTQAHELLEDDWREYKNIWRETQNEIFWKKAKAVQGLINGATALALYYDKKRPHSYEKIWKVFEKYKPLLEEIDLPQMNKYFMARDLLIKINKNIVID